MLGSKSSLSLGVGTTLPVAFAVRQMMYSVSSTAAAISAAVGISVAAAGMSSENPMQQFSFGMRVVMRRLSWLTCFRSDAKGSTALDRGRATATRHH